MNILFIHQNFPAQFKHMAPALARDPGNTVVAVGQKQDHSANLPGVRHLWYAEPQGPSQGTHQYLRRLEASVRRGQVAFRVLDQLAREGFKPDLICAHTGWGESFYLREACPDVPVLGYFEFYYHPTGADVGFDPEFPADLNDSARVRTLNAGVLLGLESCDRGLVPTRWQHSLFPTRYQDMLQVVHDGVDTDLLKPDPDAKAVLPDGTVLAADQEVVTYVSRNLEPYRGFHTLIRALPKLLKSRPKAHIVVVGGDDRGYGRPAPEGRTWREIYLEEAGLNLHDPDMARVHFTGRVPYPLFVRILQVSSVHVYLTCPFVLSWSMLEAMSCGCLVVGSATPPVREVLEDGKNGLLTDFFDPGRLADTVARVLDNPKDMEPLRRAARQTVQERYDLKRVCLPAQLELIKKMARG